jgi:hypothetical protein
MKKVSLILNSLLVCLVCFAQVPVEGDELLKLISLRKGNDKVNALENYIGGSIETTGASITFDQNVVIRVDLYNSNNPFFPNSTPFAGKLPKELDFTQTIFKAKSILGEGFEEDGEPANVLTISRQFPFNELDAIKISVDFRKGKMSMVSIIYQQGEAEKAEDAETAKEGEVVIRGDDYFFMIKKNVYNKEVEKFLSTLGNHDYLDKSIRMFIKKGVTFQFNQANQIKKITFFSGGQNSSKKPEKFTGFDGKMPYNLKFTDTKEIVKQKAGTAKNDDGNKMTYLDSNCQIEIIFNGNTVSEVSIGIPDETKK